MGTLKTAIIGVLFTVLFAFALIGFVGSFSAANNMTQNNTIGGEYAAIANAMAGPKGGLFGAAYISNSTSTITNAQNKQGILGAVSAFVSALGVGWNLIWELPALFGNIMQFAAAPLELLGIPTAFAIVIMGAIFGILGFLVILSIISLTPN